MHLKPKIAEEIITVDLVYRKLAKTGENPSTYLTRGVMVLDVVDWNHCKQSKKVNI